MFALFSQSTPRSNPPLGLKWRSSVWFITLVVGFGVATDLFTYAVIIPVIPFRLEALGYRDASARTGWLLFAYSGGLAVSTPPIAWFSERYNARRTPLILGLFALLGSQIMFMLAPFYWLMALSRIIQGISSTCVWTVGLALLCDTTPEARVGQQLGLAMAGLSAGVVLAPPIGGALYQRLGFNAPFIFCVGVVLLDLAGRLLVIERKTALLWGVDPAATVPIPSSNQGGEVHAEDSETSDKNSLSAPVPKDGVSERDNPVIVADLNGKLVRINGEHNNAVFGITPAADTRASTPEHHDHMVAVSPRLAVKQMDDKTAPTSEVINSPAIFFDPSGQLTVVERKVAIAWNAHDESKKIGVKTQQVRNMHVFREKEERGVKSQLVQSDVVTLERAPETVPQLSSMQVLSALFHSRRALAAFGNTLIYGVTYSSQEPTLPLRLQNPYGMSSLKVGLVYIASSVPTLVSGPLAGWLSDRNGTGLITIICLLLAIPWFIVMAIHGPLALLIMGVVISNFFISAVVAPLTAELAAVTKELPGVGYSHVYGAFNLAYGLGSAIGPILGGQLYDRVPHGWTAVVGLAAGLVLAASIIAFMFTDETPAAKRLLGLRKVVMQKQTQVSEA